MERQRLRGVVAWVALVAVSLAIFMFVGARVFGLGTQPWMVTGTGVEYTAAGDFHTLSIEYVLPGGGTGTWMRITTISRAGNLGPPFDEWYACWITAEIGKRIPDCALAEGTNQAELRSRS